MKLEGVTSDGEVIPLGNDILPSERAVLCGLGAKFACDLTLDEWRKAGEYLGKVEQNISWWLGDWWAFGEARYGERKAIVAAEDWEGPPYDTCRWAGSISQKFGRPNNPDDAGLPRRRDNLTFQHHAEVAALPPDEADALSGELGRSFKMLSVRQLTLSLNEVAAE